MVLGKNDLNTPCICWILQRSKTPSPSWPSGSSFGKVVFFPFNQSAKQTIAAQVNQCPTVELKGLIFHLAFRNPNCWHLVLVPVRLLLKPLQQTIAGHCSVSDFLGLFSLSQQSPNSDQFRGTSSSNLLYLLYIITYNYYIYITIVNSWAFRSKQRIALRQPPEFPRRLGALAASSPLKRPGQGLG